MIYALAATIFITFTVVLKKPNKKHQRTIWFLENLQKVLVWACGQWFCFHPIAAWEIQFLFICTMSAISTDFLRSPLMHTPQIELMKQLNG